MDLTPGLRRLALFCVLLSAPALTLSGANDAAAQDEPESPYVEIITVALPVVTLQGTVDAKGVVDVTKLLIRADRGSTVRVLCSGGGCPAKRVERLMLTTRLRLGAFERKLKPKMTLTLKIAKGEQLGKFVRYEIRRNSAPVREDDCLDGRTGKVRPCFVG